jgi:hypothetical protein
MPRGTCILCEKECELQLSHVLPAFVFRWKRETGIGHFRTTREPNLRVQDGVKEYWLCPSCEELFGRSEKRFADHIFYPYLAASGTTIRYSQWLLHFCTSVSWRVLRFFLSKGNFNDWEPESIARISEAEVVWREYLLGKRPHPGEFQQHLLPLDQISSSSTDLAPNINRYIMRAIHMDFCRGPKSIFTYSKLGRFIIFGFVHESNYSKWKGTKVHATSGFIGPKEYILPRELLEYLNSKALQASQALGSVSDKQQTKIEESFRKNQDQYIGSDAFAAMQADVELFGSKTFSKRNPGSNDDR